MERGAVLESSMLVGWALILGLLIRPGAWIRPPSPIKSDEVVLWGVQGYVPADIVQGIARGQGLFSRALVVVQEDVFSTVPAGTAARNVAGPQGSKGP